MLWLIAAMMLTVNTHALSAPNPLKGKRYFQSYCLICHGEDGKGKGPLAKKLNLQPADLSSEEYQQKGLQELTALIEGYGRKEGSNMPTWGTVLPKTDLRDIGAYITKLDEKKLSYIGDTRRGRAIYKSACIACHGEYGKGDGILAYLIDIPMIDHTNADSMEAINDEELVYSIRVGKGHYMASWKGTLDDSEIADVAAYVRLLPALTSQETLEIKPDPFEGRRLYRAYCLVCHGVDGKSIGPLASKLDLKPANLSSAQYQEKTVKQVAAIIAGYGRKEGATMPRWGAVFSRTDLHNVAAYIPRLSREDLHHKGDTRRGRAIFKGACVACHGQFGTGNGVLAQIINIPMVDFTDSVLMDQISDEEILSAIREGKGAFMA